MPPSPKDIASLIGTAAGDLLRSVWVRQAIQGQIESRSRTLVLLVLATLLCTVSLMVSRGLPSNAGPDRIVDVPVVIILWALLGSGAWAALSRGQGFWIALGAWTAGGAFWSIALCVLMLLYLSVHPFFAAGILAWPALWLANAYRAARLARIPAWPAVAAAGTVMALAAVVSYALSFWAN